jgi:hemerythrin-like domain-containing protein
MVDSQSPNQTELKALLERKETLQARLNKIKADIAAGLSKHAVQRAIELENAEVLDEIARVTAEELQQVEDSINRLNVV